MAATGIPNVVGRIQAHDKAVPWYNPSLGYRLTRSTRELLETYSNIPADEVENHVHKIVLIPLP
jgi:hypothetical protein